MKRIDIRKRKISRTMCRCCGSCNEVWFDEEHDEYICVRCLLIEREKIDEEDEQDEDKMNEMTRLRNENI